MTNSDKRQPEYVHPKKSSGLSAATLGRRIGMLAYWIALVYVLAAGAYSIIPQVFGYRKPAEKSVIDPRKCIKQTRTLDLELQSKANDFCVRLSTPKLRKWLKRWDERYRSVVENCGAPDTDRVEIKALRDGLESMVNNCERKQP